MNKYYIDVLEDVGNTIKWGIVLGSPNPEPECYFQVEGKEKAFEIRNKLRAYLDSV